MLCVTARGKKSLEFERKIFSEGGKNANKTRHQLDSRRQLKLVGCTMSHIISKLCGVKSSERMEFVIIIVVIILFPLFSTNILCAQNDKVSRHLYHARRVITSLVESR